MQDLFGEIPRLRCALLGMTIPFEIVSKRSSILSIIQASLLVSDHKIIFSMRGVGKRYRSTNKQVLREIYLSFF